MRGSGVEPYEKIDAPCLLSGTCASNASRKTTELYARAKKYDNHYYYCTSSNLKVEKIGIQHQLCATLKVIASPNAYT